LPTRERSLNAVNLQAFIISLALHSAVVPN
jgi:hypothetical protein